MVKFSPDSDRIKELEKLQKEKENTEKEFEEKEEQKKKELNDLRQQKEQEMHDVETKLVDAVAQLISPEEEEVKVDTEIKEQVRVLDELEETPTGKLQEEISLEETITQEKDIKKVSAGQTYEIQGSDLEKLPELYGQVKRAITEGDIDSFAVKAAMDFVYQINKKDLYMSQEAQEMVRHDEIDSHYVQRLGSLLETLERGTERGMYK